MKKEATLLECKFNLARVERLAERTSQDGKENFTVKAAGVRMPFDIEERGEGGLHTVFQHIHPPRILCAGRHVIGHDVEQQTHSAVLQFGLQGRKVFFTAQLWVDARGIGDIVSVVASLTAGQNWRQIQIRNSQFVKVIENPARVREAEVLVELHPIRRRWQAFRRHFPGCPRATECGVAKPGGSSLRGVAPQPGLRLESATRFAGRR